MFRLYYSDRYDSESSLYPSWSDGGMITESFTDIVDLLIEVSKLINTYGIDNVTLAYHTYAMGTGNFYVLICDKES